MNSQEMKRQRNRKGMTQGQFASWLGCSKSAVIAWENDQNKIPSWVINRIEADKPTLFPKFTMEEFAAAQKKADAAGMSLTEWLEDIIKKAILVFILYLWITW